MNQSDEPPTGEQIVGALASTGRMVSESVDRLSAVVGGCGADTRQMQSEISSLKEEMADMKRYLHRSPTSTSSGEKRLRLPLALDSVPNWQLYMKLFTLLLGRVPKSLNLNDPDVTTVFFNAHSSKSTSCYDCPITYNGVYADSHGALDIATGKVVLDHDFPMK